MSITPYQAFHEKNLGILAFPFLFPEDRESLGQAAKAWRNAKLGFEVQGYKSLQDRIEGEKAIYMADGPGLHQEMLLDVLGAGGSKKAIALQEGRALMVPNMDADSMYAIVIRWKRMVHEEVAMSQLLTKVGLLSPVSRRVTLSLSEDSHEGRIPAYLSETFESLGKTKGWLIIDTKNWQSSTWKQGRHFLFNSEEERLTEKNWDSVVDSALTDVAKIAMYDIPAGGDSLNIAVLKKPSDSSVSQYEIRYFGFDFSSKYGQLTIPQIQKKPSKSPIPARAVHLLDSMLDDVFSWEFGHWRYSWGEESEKAKLRSLKDRLVERYSKDIIARMSSSS